MKNNKSNIQLISVTKKYKDRNILHDVNLTISPGTIVSLLGANGAGKSTLIKLILGLTKPSKGRIYLNGFAPSDPRSRLKVGAVLQATNFAEELTARELIVMVGKHYPSNIPVSKLIINFSLQNFLNKPVRNLSLGQKRRVALALAFVGNPKIIFLDEPSVGLDVESRQKLWQFIHEYRQPDTTIFLTTHYLEEAQALSDRIVLLQTGNIIADGTVHEICSSFAKSKIFFKMLQHNEWLSSQTNLSKVKDNYYAIETDDADAVVREMVTNNIPFKELEIRKVSLEDVFVQQFLR